VTIGFRQFLNFTREDVVTLCATSAEREQYVSVLPDLGSNWREIVVIEQTGHQAWNNDEHARVIKLPGEGDNMIGLRTRHRQGQVLALLKKVGLLLTQA
jgi:RES domain-containing protein